MTEKSDPVPIRSWPAAGRLGAWIGANLAAERERWLLWVPVGLGSGIAVYFALDFEPPLALGLVGFGLVLAFGLLARRSQAGIIFAIALGSVFAGFAAAQLRTALVAAAVLEDRFGPGRVTGQVLAVEPRGKGGRAGGRMILGSPRLDGVEPPQTPVKLRIRRTAKDSAVIRPGDWVAIRAALRPPSRPAAPGAFDFARRAYFQQLGAVGYAVGHVARIDPPPAGDPGLAVALRQGWNLWWAELRQSITERILAALPGESGAVAAALMTGERAAISKMVIAAMRDSGLAHLLAISGLHVGLVAGILFVGLRAVGASIPAIALRFPIKKWAAAAAGIGAFVYLQLSGATVPTQRAFLMLSLVLLAVILDRTAVSLRLVAWAALAVLLIAPESLLSASFQMSFGAVTALVAAYEVVRERRVHLFAERGLSGRIALYLAGVALTSVIAILATGPFAVFHFNRLAVYGLVANLVAVPLTALWIMPWAVLAFVLMPLGLEAFALVPMSWGIEGVIAVAQAVAAWPGAVIPIPAMPTAGVALVAVGGLWLCLWARRWRTFGLVVVAVGLMTIPLNAPPDVLVSGDGKLLALRMPEGSLWLSTRRAERFTADIWLRRAGLAEGRLWPKAGSAEVVGAADLRCDSLGCVHRREGVVAAFARDGRALAEDCAVARVVVSLVPVPRGTCLAPELVIDRFDLWRRGAHALWFEGDRLRVSNVAERQGQRPWAKGRGRRRSASNGG